VKFKAVMSVTMAESLADDGAATAPANWGAAPFWRRCFD